jgi:hypothetical protein
MSAIVAIDQESSIMDIESATSTPANVAREHVSSEMDGGTAQNTTANVATDEAICVQINEIPFPSTSVIGGGACTESWPLLFTSEQR